MAASHTAMRAMQSSGPVNSADSMPLVLMLPLVFGWQKRVGSCSDHCDPFC